jgi:glycosyltransferase involved in cell wall biosynthesis
VAGNNDLVSVIIPAFNAGATLDETLRSARGQTHRNLEIIVVDDGSVDATAAIAETHAQADGRVRIIRQQNKGVSAARNLAIAASHGAFFAPLDADDLWRADKIEIQLRAMRESGAAFVYCWPAIIDQSSRIVWLDSRSKAEGDVLRAIAARNIVANGSAPLMTRRSLEEAGGYDETLRGCEDYKLYFRIAERHTFALVREFLVAYRVRPDSISSNFDVMLAEHARCEAEFMIDHPECARLLRRNRTRLMRFMALRSGRWGDWKTARRLVRQMVQEDPVGTLVNAFDVLVRKAKRTAGAQGCQPELLGTIFPIGEPPS